MSHPFPDSDVAGALGAAVVAIDLLCVGCGYNLRTLSVDACCPECGTRVRRSMLLTPLRDADPRWLARLAGGMSWLGLMVVLDAVTVPFLVGAAWAAMTGESLHAVVRVGLLLLPLVSAVAAWRMSPREPGPGPHGPTRVLSTWIRLATAVQMSAAVLFIVGLSNGAMLYWIVGSLLAFAFASAWRFLAALDLVRVLCLRIPDAGLARSAARLWWGYLVGLALVGLGLPIAVGGGWDGLSPAPFAAGNCVVVLLSLFFAVIMEQARHALTRAALEARAQCGAPDGGSNPRPDRR